MYSDMGAGPRGPVDGRPLARALSGAVTGNIGRRWPAGIPVGRLRLALMAVVGVLPACAPASLVQGVGLSNYDALTPSDGLVTKSRLTVNKADVLAAKTVRIVPTTFPADVAPKLTPQQRDLVANSVNRALCVGLSDRFEMVAPDQPADLTVRASVTQVTETDELMAGLSTVASIGTSFVDVGVPIPTPRIPIGMGSLSMEAEAVDPAGRPQASMLWARGAGALFSTPRMSKVGDAYELADSFGEDFAFLLVKGQSPFADAGIELPSWQKVNSAMGLPHKHEACARYGLYPGLAGLVSGQLGMPPEWTDAGGKPPAP